MTLWTAIAETEQKQEELTGAVLGALGTETHVSHKEDLDRATASGGTSLAYVLLGEELLDDGACIQLPRCMAQEPVIQTMLGAATTPEMTGRHRAELKNVATSPGGTTAEPFLQLGNEAVPSFFKWSLLLTAEVRFLGSLPEYIRF